MQNAVPTAQPLSPSPRQPTESAAARTPRLPQVLCLVYVAIAVPARAAFELDVSPLTGVWWLEVALGLGRILASDVQK